MPRPVGQIVASPSRTETKVKAGSVYRCRGNVVQRFVGTDVVVLVDEGCDAGAQFAFGRVDV